MPAPKSYFDHEQKLHTYEDMNALLAKRTAEALAKVTVRVEGQADTRPQTGDPGLSSLPTESDDSREGEPTPSGSRVSGGIADHRGDPAVLETPAVVALEWLPTERLTNRTWRRVSVDGRFSILKESNGTGWVYLPYRRVLNSPAQALGRADSFQQAAELCV